MILALLIINVILGKLRKNGNSKCNLKRECKQNPKCPAFDLEKNVYSLPVQLKDKFRFVCSDCGVETVLDGELYMINMYNEHLFCRTR